MNIVSKVLAGIGLLATAFAAGWFSRPPVVQTETKIVTVEKEVVKTVKEVVTKPDGTTTTTETSETTKDTSTTTKDKTKDTPPAPVAVATVRRDWSVGIAWQPDWRDRTWLPAQGEVGYRVFADAWVVGAYNWKENHALLGVRWEF
jgi:hypothetical protein